MTTQNDSVAKALAIHFTNGDPRTPDLLANPWLLVEALWKRGYQIDFRQKWVIVYVIHNEGANYYEIPIIDGDLARALLEAAAKMLEQEK